MQKKIDSTQVRAAAEQNSNEAHGVKFLLQPKIAYFLLLKIEDLIVCVIIVLMRNHATN